MILTAEFEQELVGTKDSKGQEKGTAKSQALIKAALTY
jgi:hypothetical protein